MVKFLTEARRLPNGTAEGTIEPCEGGAVSLMGGHIRGVVTIWQPHKAFGYTWNVFQPGEAISAGPVSYLEFALQQNDGKTKLVLIHRPIPEAMQKQTAMGWNTGCSISSKLGWAGNFPNARIFFPKPRRCMASISKAQG